MYVCICIYILHRGKEFRVEYSHLSELRSLISPGINIMALTATASDATLACIVRDTGMMQPVIVQVSPDKQNLL